MDEKSEDELETLDSMQQVALRVLCQAASMKQQLFDYGMTEFEGLNQDRAMFQS